MNNKPLFGAGSAKSVRQKQRPKFLRHNDTPDNRLTGIIAAQPLQTQTPCAPKPQQPVQAQPAPSPPAPQTIPAALSENDINNRQHTRMRTLKGGTIILPGQMMSSFNCKIQNESVGGVLLRVATAISLPDEFYLIRDSDPGHKTPCQVMWRKHDKVGVKFVSHLSSQ